MRLHTKHAFHALKKKAALLNAAAVFTAAAPNAWAKGVFSELVFYAAFPCNVLPLPILIWRDFLSAFFSELDAQHSIFLIGVAGVGIDRSGHGRISF